MTGRRVPAPGQIFISYRRDDAAGYARAVYDELARCFGAGRVFIDVDDINAGQPFSEVIQRSVGESAVLLALIGKRWHGPREGSAPRISEAGDLVRQEVAAALAKGIRVIPVLLLPSLMMRCTGRKRSYAAFTCSSKFLARVAC